jgi:hypothetical protein
MGCPFLVLVENREMRIEGAFRTLDEALNWRMPPEP